MAYTNYEFFYEGGGSTLSPEYSELFVGYRVPAGRISSPTSIQTADQLREVSSRLSEGVKAIEMQPISPEVFEAIPKQHFKEIDRMTKLTGAEISVHAPMIDPAGFTREGWSETEREVAERHLLSVIERSHDINPKGNVPITVHASGVGGTEYAVPSPEVRKEIVEDLTRRFTHPKEYGGEGLSWEEARRRAEKEAEKTYMVVVNQETGQMTAVKREIKYSPEAPTTPKITAPVEILGMINRGEWSSNLARAMQFKKMADELLEGGQAVMQHVQPQLQAIKDKMASGIQPDEKDKAAIAMYEQANQKIEKSDAFLRDIMAMLRNYYSTAYKFDPDSRETLEKSTQPYLQYNEDSRRVQMQINKVFQESLRAGMGREEAIRRAESIKRQVEPQIVGEFSVAVDNLIKGLSSAEPKIYAPIEEFSLKRSAKTFGDATFKAFQKFGESTPIVNIENLYPGMAFSRAEDVKKLVEESRNQFVESAKKTGMNEAEAKRAAERFIGATWDFGHISMLRKGGFPASKIVEETKIIAPYVKHVHFADNFGFTDSHLPPGMGTMPTKEMMEELEKAGYGGKTVVEAGAFVQHFKTSPHPFVLEALGSPLYSAYMQPFWNQIRSTYGAYFGGYGTMLPEQHFSMYGGGFSTLPVELGGQVQGRQSRFAGTPTE